MNNSKSLYSYKINQEILTPMSLTEPTIKEHLSFQNLSDVMIFSRKNTGIDRTFVEDINGHCQSIESIFLM